ncbi:hypothetical protein TEA_009070 [Camellia sinensis var. sinensis]|uniref:non-specific serine/threonine protein kinase n=1 Tax=Camellia sinensis var. sinensis TaxID=542762 RepID=A0A4S4DMC7_CAMSN|nr:hypothetical protein TEA_009070 [Camellia sinensis var. sinensis]
MGKCHNLTSLKMSNNNISGEIPLELVEAAQLQKLDLSSNYLVGEIPTKLGRLVSLFDLKLNDNELSGNIPQVFGKLSNLENLNLAANNLSGPIPIELWECLKLLSLNLSNNRIGKNIPLEIGHLQGLQSLDLGYNLLIDVSFNQLKGHIPNMKAFLEAPFEALRDIFMAFHKKVRNTTDEPRQVHNQNLFAIWSYDVKMVYENIIEATENFSTKHWVGEGGCGTVYRADLPSGQVVAVKKLHESPDGDLTNLQSFMSEICALIEIRHQNIVKLYGYCSHPRHSFLVYEFLEGGSSGNMLSTKDQVLQFDWIKRVNVAKGVANALSYMHHNCSPPIIHRDISSKNALLDLEYVAHISDFGTAKFLKLNSSNWTSFAQTYGYAAAPELAYIMEVNERCDVYSFGVHKLELITGKHLGDLISSVIVVILLLININCAWDIIEGCVGSTSLTS